MLPEQGRGVCGDLGHWEVEGKYKEMLFASSPGL